MIERAVDADGSLRTHLRDNPLATPTSPARRRRATAPWRPHAAEVADRAAPADAGPSRRLRDRPCVAAHRPSAADMRPAFIPPEAAPCRGADRPPAFIPPERRACGAVAAGAADPRSTDRHPLWLRRTSTTDRDDDPIDDKPMPLLDHLIELRRRLLWSIVAFLIALRRLLLLLRRRSTASWRSRWPTSCSSRATRAGG